MTPVSDGLPVVRGERFVLSWYSFVPAITQVRVWLHHFSTPVHDIPLGFVLSSLPSLLHFVHLFFFLFFHSGIVPSLSVGGSAVNTASLFMPWDVMPDEHTIFIEDHPNGRFQSKAPILVKGENTRRRRHSFSILFFFEPH